jgi:hypothetical protein
MLRSTERSGTYRISARGHAIRKNAQSLARDGAPNLMTLHYLAGEFPSASTVAIDMTVSEAELMALPCDLTLMDGPPLKPFAEQTLEINGIMVHRPPTLIRRAIDALIAR